MRPSGIWRAALALLFWGATVSFAPAEPGQFSERWETLENCRLVESEWNDGDSFHVVSGGKEYIFRLYFVDAPETHDVSPGKSRTTEQARYWKISKPALAILAGVATEFSVSRLKGAPFTVRTRWEDAKGQSKLPRNFAVITTSSGDLAELLVANGLARIYGHYLAHPGGLPANRYRERLRQLEERAQSASLGAWGVTGASPGGKSPGKKRPSGKAAPVAAPVGAGDEIPAF